METKPVILKTTPVKYRAVDSSRSQQLQAWDTMKPFVKFGFKAMLLVAKATVGIIKLVPELLSESKRPTRR
jgi:hypothetical protein